MNSGTPPVTPEGILDLKKAYLFPCVYHFYRNPPVIVSGNDVWLFDQSGKRYLDCYSGVTVASAGHCHPKIVAAIAEQAARLNHTTTIYLTEPMFRLAEELAHIAPGDIKRSFFCASGTEANEAALLLASLSTGRQGVIALSDSLHGRTKWAMSVTGLDLWRTDGALLQNVHFVNHANCPHCAWGVRPEACSMPCVGALEQAIIAAGPDTIAALIAEPIQGNGGIVVPPPGYWQQVRALCDKYGILLIFDEVQTAMNRSGTWFAATHWETVPDIVTLAKALGNGMPIAAVMTTDALASAYTRPGASTFGANPVSCAAALATLGVHREEGLGRRATEMGALFLECLARAADASPFLKHPRGKGLMLGIEVTTPSGEADAGRCDDFLEQLKDLGFLAGKTGRHRNVLTFMPPLTIRPEHVQALGNALNRIACAG